MKLKGEIGMGETMKLKGEIGMGGPKRIQIRFVGIIMSTIHRYACFSRV